MLSIEPNPFAVRQNVERSQLENVFIEHTTCGESHDVVRLYLHTESNSSMASLFTESVSGDVAVEVPCTNRLCQVHSLQRVKLVNVDVEGAELFVLRGMKQLMRELRPVIVVELHAQVLEAVGIPLHEVEAFLRDLDYVLEPLGGHSNYACRPKIGGH